MRRAHEAFVHFVLLQELVRRQNLINSDLPYSLSIEPKHAQAGAICDSAMLGRLMGHAAHATHRSIIYLCSA